MRCVALDDEPLALNVIDEFCSSVSYLYLVAKCTSSLEAIEVLNHNEIDLMFVDIQMPHLNGLEFIGTLTKAPLIIFTTAFSEHALDGFELGAVDYLVKPIPFPRFLKAVNKAYELFTLRNSSGSLLGVGNDVPPPNQNEAGRYMLVRVDGRTVRVDFDRIKYVEGLKDYIRIVVNGEKPLLTKSTMKKIEEHLSDQSFRRVHKSYIVAMDKIDAIENHRIVIGDKYIPIGDFYKDEFYLFLDRYKL